MMNGNRGNRLFSLFDHFDFLGKSDGGLFGVGAVDVDEDGDGDADGDSSRWAAVARGRKWTLPAFCRDLHYTLDVGRWAVG